ncbi:MAG: hypothetical protein AB9866_27915 [Syntrophobacteraceae bacterium]
MVKSEPYHDPFMKRIREILFDASVQTSKGTIRNLVFSEVQSYSREVQETEKTSDLFLRLCELFVDCESIAIPDQYFKVMVAKLLHECSFSKAPSNEELRELIGMDAASIEAAMAYFKDKDCLVSTQGKAGDRKRSMKRDPMPAAELETK